jgi:DNA ligase D-like protein (predicted 3'-phosphoesterase)
MPLKEYDKKRNFKVTPEPSGKIAAKPKQGPLLYVIQKHRATALHYDFRIEWNGVLLSWAVRQIRPSSGWPCRSKIIPSITPLSRA